MKSNVMKLALAVFSATRLAGAAQVPPNAVKSHPSAAAAQAPANAAKSHLAAAAAQAPANASKSHLSAVAAQVPANASKSHLSAAAAQVPANASKSHPSAAAKAEKVMPDIGALMATSQTSLAQAEALYSKAVQGGKANFSQLLTAQAGAMAASIRTYADSLSKAEAKLELAVNTTRAGVTASAASAPKQFVSFAAMEGVAALSAKVEFMASEARRMSRLGRSAQERAVGQAVDQLADTEELLSRKLGDLSTMSEDAKAIVQAAGPGDESLPASKAVASPKPALTGQPASLAELSKNLVAAKTAAKADTKTAEKQFAAALSQASAQLGAGANKIKAALEVAEKEEISRVKANKVDPEAPQPHHRHHRHHHSIFTTH